MASPPARVRWPSPPPTAAVLRQACLRDAERNAADRLYEKCSVRGTIREMYVDVFDTFALEKVDEKQCIPRA